MADLNVLPYVHHENHEGEGGLLGAALRLYNARQNERTQRMFAENTMARQSAEDKRRELEGKEKQADKERQRRIDQATALGTIQQMMRQPGGAGPGQALAAAYDIPLNPLQAAVSPPPAAPQGDAVDQLLSSPEGAAAATPDVGGGPVEGPAPAPSVTSGGMAPVVAASREGAPGETLEGPQQVQDAGPAGRFLLPTAFHVSPGMQAAMDHKGYVPPGSAELASGPAPGAPGAGDLESLMSRAAPQPTPNLPPPPAPTNPLYEAVLGGHHYPISTEQPKSGLSPKFEAVYQADLSMGASPQAAFGKAYAAQQTEEKEAATEHRMLAVLGGRNTQQDQRDATYHMTVEDQKAKDTAHLANARAVARIKAAANSPGIDPKAQAFLAHALDMAEKGATDAEIAAAGRDARIDPKVWTGQVNAEDRKANADLRSGERRASAEFHSADGTISGIAASPQEATKLRDKESKFGVVQQRVQDLIDDVKANGTRVDLMSPDQIQQRLSKGAAANAALRPYNGLGGTDTSQKLEADITGALGTPGHGWLFGANPAVLNRILSEAQDKHRRDIQIGLRPGGGVPLPAAITHEKSKDDAIDAQLDWARSLPGARVK